MKKTFFLIIGVLLASCSADVPAEFVQTDTKPSLEPDYTDLTIPANIAPLNFCINGSGEEFVTRITSGGKQAVFKGRTVGIPRKKWRELTAAAGTMEIEVFTREGKDWKRYRPFSMEIAEDIDPYISYRLIPPSYISFERLSLNQRNLTSFNEKLIYSNNLVQKDDDQGQCINCHNYRNYRTDNMQFHARQYKAGTVLVYNGELKKINLKTDSTLSAGVYPAWHPTHDYIAYSNNVTKQGFYVSGNDRIEGLDLFSDLILYNVPENEVSIIENDSNRFECFPTWSPDGRTLYYISAEYEAEYSDTREEYLMIHHDSLQYDLWSKDFDPDTRTWKPAVRLIDAAAMNRSISIPRVSPDGRYMMVVIGQHGVLPLYNSDSDLYLINLSTMEMRDIDEINSDKADSYHSWSSNGKWVIFSSKRQDGDFTRLYITHFNEDATFSKPFVLPQRNPGFNTEFMKAYNVPEFMIEPVSIRPRQFARLLDRHPAVPAKYVSRKQTSEQTDTVPCAID